MLGRHIFFSTILLWAMAVVAIAQPTQVAIYYFDDPHGTNPPLGCPCSDRTPYHDGTVVCAFRDVDVNGPSSADTSVGCWVMNGMMSGIGAGYFILDDPALTLEDVEQPIYVMVNSGCCWFTQDYTIVPGYQSIVIPWADWTCYDSACVIWDPPPSPPESLQVTLCAPCMCVHVTWEHDGLMNIGGFVLFKEPHLLVAAFPASARDATVNLQMSAPGRFFIRAYNAIGLSVPSNFANDSSLALWFSSGAGGDVQGNHSGGSEFTLHFEYPGSSPADCPTVDSLWMLQDGVPTYLLGVDSVVSEITGHFPDLYAQHCRVLLTASGIRGRSFTVYDTTESTFDIMGEGADPGNFPLPSRTEIGAVYPNPFNPETRIQFTVSAPGEVSLTVYNLSGQRVRSLVKENYTPGTYSAIWDGKTDAGVPAGTGVYLCRLNAAKTINTKKLFLLR